MGNKPNWRNLGISYRTKYLYFNNSWNIRSARGNMYDNNKINTDIKNRQPWQADGGYQ